MNRGRAWRASRRGRPASQLLRRLTVALESVATGASVAGVAFGAAFPAVAVAGKRNGARSTCVLLRAFFRRGQSMPLEPTVAQRDSASRLWRGLALLLTEAVVLGACELSVLPKMRRMWEDMGQPLPAPWILRPWVCPAIGTIVLVQGLSVIIVRHGRPLGWHFTLTVCCVAGGFGTIGLGVWQALLVLCCSIYLYAP